MVDPRFFAQAGPTALSVLAEVSGAALSDATHGALAVETIGALGDAGPEALSFLDNKKYAPALKTTRAGAVVIHSRFLRDVPEGCGVLLSDDPYRAYARCAAYLHPVSDSTGGVHPSAFVADSAVVDPSAEISPGAVIEAGAEIGAKCRIGPNAVIGAGVVLGDATVIGANATVSHAVLGARCEIHPGVRIGTRGFGFAMGAQGHESVPQLGRVMIGDDVEIGANATIDRGAGPDTVIGDGCRIDNLVQIAHNVTLGRGCVVVAQSGVAGSTKVGDFAALGAQSGVAGHLTIGPGAKLAAQCGVMRDVAPGEAVGGSPAVGFRDWMRQTAWLKAAIRKGGKDEGK